MFDAVLSLVMGIILIGGFLAAFIANLNTDNLDDSAVMLLGFTVTIGLILLVYGFVKMMRKGTGGL